MNKKTIWTIVIIVVLVAAGIVLLNLPKEGGNLVGPSAPTSTPETVGKSETPAAVQPVVTPITPGEEKNLPGESIKLTVTASGFTPNEFTVSADSMVNLAVSSGDQWTHVFKFDDPSLQNVALGLAGGETRMITFKAPAAKSDYSFYCDVPGHRGRGEQGVMHIK